MSGDDGAAAREAELLARIAASKARIEHLATLTQWMQAHWAFVEAEERRRDPCAPAQAVEARVRERVEAELRERGLDDGAGP